MRENVSTPRLIPLPGLVINLAAYHRVVNFCNADEAAGCSVPRLTHDDVGYILCCSERPLWWT